MHECCQTFTGNLALITEQMLKLCGLSCKLTPQTCPSARLPRIVISQWFAHATLQRIGGGEGKMSTWESLPPNTRCGTPTRNDCIHHLQCIQDHTCLIGNRNGISRLASAAGKLALTLTAFDCFEQCREDHQITSCQSVCFVSIYGGETEQNLGCL